MLSVDNLHREPHGELVQHEDTQTCPLSIADDLTTLFEATFDKNVESLPVLKSMFVTGLVHLEHSRNETQCVHESLTVTSEAFSTFALGQESIVRFLKRDLKTLETKFTQKEAEFTEDILALKTDNSALKADNTALKADNTALKADNLALKADNLALKSDILALHAKVDGLLDMFLQR
jgi:hypothetical protein